MSAPATRDLTFVAGDDYAHRITITEGAGVATDVSDSTWRAQVRRKATSPHADASFTVDTTNADDGIIVLALATAVTQELDGIYVWSLERDAGGVMTTVLEGHVIVRADITRTSS